jgi:hypothetical protein
MTSTLAGLALAALLSAQGKGVWTDPKDPSLPPDFALQGEYAGDKMGAQVIALGAGAFQAVVYPGGLPGAGWDGTSKILMAGRLEGDRAVFAPAEGSRKYLAQKPEEFSATRKFPPEGQKAWSGEAVAAGALKIKTEDGKTLELARTFRKSPTLGAKPPEGAIVLFDGKNTDEWNGGRLDAATGLLNTDGKDIVTKRKFSNYTMHLEFMLPYRPDARGQGRGNSGFYQVDHYECQILDSFGLDGLNNECGGFYTKAAPKVNMCLPPLAWQTYDVEFTNAVQGPDGKKAKNAVATVRHNGVVIHESQEISDPTGGHRKDPEGTPGPIKLQGHGNPLQFRNVWIVEKK